MAFTHSMLGCQSLHFACLLYLSDNHSLTIGIVWLNPPTSLNSFCRLNWNNWPDCYCMQFACLYLTLVKNLHRITWRVCSLNCLPHGPCDVNRKSMDLVSCNLHLFICLTHTGSKSANCLTEGTRCRLDATFDEETFLKIPLSFLAEMSTVHVFLPLVNVHIRSVIKIFYPNHLQ